MQERYTKLFTLSEIEEQGDGCPIQVTAGALLRDTEDDRDLVQIRYKNTSDMGIKSVAVRIYPYDSTGTQLLSQYYVYKDIAVNPGETFGDRVLVVLPTDYASSYKVTVTEVLYADGDIWSMDKLRVEERIRTAADEITRRNAISYGKGRKIFDFVLFFLLVIGAVGCWMVYSAEKTTAVLSLGISFTLAAVLAFPILAEFLGKMKNGKTVTIIRITAIIILIGANILMIRIGIFG